MRFFLISPARRPANSVFLGLDNTRNGTACDQTVARLFSNGLPGTSIFLAIFVGKSAGIALAMLHRGL